MHRAFRHLLATLACVVLFSIHPILPPIPHPRAASLINPTVIAALCLVVLAPVVSIAEHLFSRRWALSAYLQVPALVPLLFLYLFPWSLLFGSLFLTVLLRGTAFLILPLWLYWAVFQVSNRAV